MRRSLLSFLTLSFIRQIDIDIRTQYTVSREVEFLAYLLAIKEQRPRVIHVS